jgi:pectinesterase
MPNAVVAPDGSGDFTTIQAAIDAVPQNTRADRRWVILLRPGTYRERVYIQREKRFLSLVGVDPARVVITYDLDATKPGPDGKPIGTFRTATVDVDADDFTAENVTFENAAGPVGQAVALRLDGDRSTFRNCRVLGWQDSLLLNRGRHYFERSLIAGHVDFVFGGATAYFDRCRLHCWRSGYITAASTPKEVPYGFVFANARITGAPGVATYLGRPWRDFASVIWIDTDMSEVVRREGWHNWDRPERERTARFREFGSRGPGASPSARAPWTRLLSRAEASAASVTRVLAGSDGWDPRKAPSHASPVDATEDPFPVPGAAAPTR